MKDARYEIVYSILKLVVNNPRNCEITFVRNWKSKDKLSVFNGQNVWRVHALMLIPQFIRHTCDYANILTEVVDDMQNDREVSFGHLVWDNSSLWLTFSQNSR